MDKKIIRTSFLSVLVVVSILTSLLFPKTLLAHGMVGTIFLLKDSYDPINVTIYKDEKLVFKNETKDKRWPQVSFKSSPKKPAEHFSPDKPLAQSQTWLFKFQYAGDWQYKDLENPKINGTIKVIVGRGISRVVPSGNYSQQSLNLWQRIVNFIQSFFKNK